VLSGQLAVMDKYWGQDLSTLQIFKLILYFLVAIAAVTACFFSAFIFVLADCLYQVFIHNPGMNRGASNLSRGRAELGTQGDISLLNINQVIGCVAAGQLDPTTNCDTLIVGTQNNLLGYDIKNNRDIFFKEVGC
jgi:Ciliary BBSome complex subunit 2, N-terminal